MHFNPYLVLLVVALPGTLIYWVQSIRKKKEANLQDIAFFGATVGGVVTAVWLVCCACASINDHESHFSDSQYATIALLAFAFGLVTVNKARAMWKTMNTPNVDDKLSSPDGGTSPTESRSE